MMCNIMVIVCPHPEIHGDAPRNVGHENCGKDITTHRPGILDASAHLLKAQFPHGNFAGSLGPESAILRVTCLHEAIARRLGRVSPRLGEQQAIPCKRRPPTDRRTRQAPPAPRPPCPLPSPLSPSTPCSLLDPIPDARFKK